MLNLSELKTTFVKIKWTECGEKNVTFLENWKDATKKTQDQIDRHFTTENAGIAVITGQESGLTVIDFDTKDNPLMMELATICPTYTITTKKGFHLYYKYIPELKQGTNRFGQGVDVRNDGGLVFCPPTPNYSVWGDNEIEELNAEAKEWLNKNYTAEKNSSQGSKNLAQSTARNSDLFRKACGWVNVYNEQEVWNRMVKANKEFRKGELDDRELDIIYKQVMKYKETGKKDDEITAQGISRVPIGDLDLLTIEKLNERTGEVKSVYVRCVENAARCLENHPEFKNKLRFDSFSQMPQIFDGEKWNRLQDSDYTHIQRKMQTMYMHFTGYGLELITQAVTSVVAKNVVDSLIEWANTLKWDGVPRVDDYAIKAYGADDTRYNHVVGKNFLLGMAARILMPGCDHRFVLILEGKQNTKKSKSFYALIGKEWFLEDAPLNIENISFFMSIWGKLVVEFSEGVIFNKVDMGKLKGLVSTKEDTIVKKWGRNNVTIPRRCVFVITTNQGNYLGDFTGNTRFFPIVTHNIDIDYITQNREQLFAEAIHRVRSGELWWNEEKEIVDEITAQQENRMAISIHEEIVDEWLSDYNNETKIEEGFQTKDFFESTDKWGDKKRLHFTTGEAREVSMILRKKGFEQRVCNVGGISKRVWKKTNNKV